MNLIYFSTGFEKRFRKLCLTFDFSNVVSMYNVKELLFFLKIVKQHFKIIRAKLVENMYKCFLQV